MGMNPFQEAAGLIVQFVFGIYMAIVLCRFLLQLARADFYNPLSQAVVKATQPLLKPMRRVIPGLAGMDLSSLVLLVALAGIQVLLMQLILTGGINLSLASWLVTAVADALDLAVTLFFVVIIVLVLISWLQLLGIAGPVGYNPILSVISTIAGLILNPASRLLPPLGGTLDLSPMLALLALYLVRILLVRPLYLLAAGL
ncbi:MAG: YggT family protein [Gammaproteobacteria bacterium]|nr:YggT family protein [Gammaproteobacteria bacterium]